jgi:hypothetical protein
VFIQIGGVLTPPPVLNALGTAQASTLSPNVSGLPIYYSPNVAAGKMLVSNRLAAAWHEDGPFQASEEDVAKLGTNVAFYGMGAASVYIPAGVVVVGT